jgi:preprotein translocase subunit SecG
VFLPLGYLSQYIFGSLLFMLSMFIIGIILLQRGKGGGLTGALGGLGGQSAFGVKAGDLFTRITAVAVLIWIFVCALACRWYLPDNLDIVADQGSSTSIGGLSTVGEEGAGADQTSESGVGLPLLESLPTAPAENASTPAPEIQNLPPQVPTDPQPEVQEPPTVPPPSENKQ